MDALTTTPPAVLTERTARRMAELDAALATAPGEGFAETLCTQLLKDLTQGDRGTLDGWEWGDREQMEADLQTLCARWAAEDGKEGNPS